MRLIRQMLTESLLLASAGGALGLAIGHYGKLLLPGAPAQATAIDWLFIASPASSRADADGSGSFRHSARPASM